jgi:hypothetical protein
MGPANPTLHPHLRLAEINADGCEISGMHNHPTNHSLHECEPLVTSGMHTHTHTHGRYTVLHPTKP